MFTKLNGLLISIIILLGSITFYLHSKVTKLDEQLAIAKSNVEQYQSIVNTQQADNRVLQLTIDELVLSNDKQLSMLTAAKDSLKIKDNQLKLASTSTVYLTDTIIEKIPVQLDFQVELKPNQLTTIKINRTADTLTCIPEIYNHQDLFIYSTKVYRNKYKNWFQRLIHFDFKKDNINRYQIINSNDLLKVIDTRVVNIVD